jgi:hypothetical protein
MKLFLILSIMSMAATTQAQEKTDTWKIILNNKVLLNTGNEDAEKNVVKIKAADWKKNGYLQVQYHNAENSSWLRSFTLNDERDAELIRKDSTTSLNLSLASLRKIFKGKKKIVIYTILLPPDPSMGVRIRRVHLCTLRLP